ncbi:hypothetical protein HYV80_05250 [Candidatus Woesearchaeota archaeon]|nr:hypothetical protein [Candidatus Woesearchaeota archaeon]
MEIELSRDMKGKLSRVSSILGVKDKDLVNRAILFYIDTISKQVELKKEIFAWDKLSDEALAKFDRLI